MIREQGLLIGNYALFTVVTFLLVGIQTTLWFLLFNDFPAPQFWVPVIIFWCLFRNLKEGLIMTYLVSFIAGTFTFMPLGLIIFINLFAYLTIYFLRKRIYWPGPTFFMLCCGFFSTIFPLVHFLISNLTEKNPIKDFLFFEWLLRSLLTTLFALPLYYLFCKIDSATHKELPSDSGGQIL